jgi:hypothetical protein
MCVSKRFILVLIFLGSFSIVFSQNSLKELSFKDRIYAGGNFGLAIGNVSTFVELAPFAGYRVTENFSLGLGGSYTHLRYNDGFFKTKLDIFGVNIFARRIINQSFFAHIEYEMLNVAPRFVQFDNKRRIWVEGLLIGGGFRQPFGNNSAFITTILFNLLESAETPYRNPIYRAGFYLGF